MANPQPALETSAPNPIAAHLGALRRLKGWTRERFGLDTGATVLVEEGRTTLEGFPPIETVVTFWTAPDMRHAFTIFKPATEIAADDLPPSWMKNGLVVEIAAGCNCC